MVSPEFHECRGENSSGFWYDFDFSESKEGLHKENMLYSLSKSECETVRKALIILQKIFKNIKPPSKDGVL